MSSQRYLWALENSMGNIFRIEYYKSVADQIAKRCNGLPDRFGKVRIVKFVRVPGEKGDKT